MQGGTVEYVEQQRAQRANAYVAELTACVGSTTGWIWIVIWACGWFVLIVVNITLIDEFGESCKHPKTSFGDFSDYTKLKNSCNGRLCHHNDHNNLMYASHFRNFNLLL